MAKTASRSAISNEAVKARTGRTWPQWFLLLDKAGARRMTHREIVAIVAREGVSSWWRQMITVWYEQSRGLRQKHETAQGFQVSGSKTVAAPVDRLYQAWTDGRLRRRWLGDADFSVRKATSNRALRLTWNSGGSVEANFYAKGAGRSQVAVGHTKLKNASTAERMKRWWKLRLEALGKLFAAPARRTRTAARRTAKASRAGKRKATARKRS